MVVDRFPYDSRKLCLCDVFLEDRWNGRRKGHF